MQAVSSSITKAPTGRVQLRQQRTAAKAPSRIATHAAATEEASVNGAVKRTNGALDFDELSDLLRMVHETDIVELDLKGKGFQLSLKKKEALEQAEPQVIHAPMQYAPAPSAYAPAPAAPAAAAPAPAPAAPAPAPAPAAAPAPAPAPAAAADGIEMAAPMAGTLYRSPAPGEPLFVKEGDRVTKGQTICIIEAMKLMNEIEAETTGTIVKFLAENGKSVTPGQPLVLIKP
ncbi:hypothetical protein N2152v2_011041 [Parachlorella kessleri]